VRGPDDGFTGVSRSLVEVLEEARAVDLLGTMDLESQIAHALGFAHAFEQAWPARHSVATEALPTDFPGRWLDLGSGGGLPGLVLAQYWPTSAGVLLDSSERRTGFLTEAVVALHWEERVRVVRARAEDAGGDPELRGGFTAVWARSFGRPPVTAECASPFLGQGGLLVVSEPPSADTGRAPELENQAVARWPREALADLGLAPLVTVRGRFGYQVVEQVQPCPERFPRRAGVTAKRPLYRIPEG
jgi:16S rRNA (guanine527-N7)-methyltransferase